MPQSKPLPEGINPRKEEPGNSQPALALPLPHHLLKIIPILLLILAIIFVYWPVRNYGFVNYDDGDYVFENPRVLDGLTLQSVIWAFTTTTSSNWHPMTWLSHMLDCQLFGLNPGLHHVTNLLFHLANTLLLFWVLKRMTRKPWASTFVAALFALHPLHVESVAWVSERKDVLNTFFWVLTMGMYVRYAECPGLKRYLLALLFFTLGLLSKPMLVTLPFVLLLLDYWPLGRFSSGKGGGNSIILQPSASQDQKSSLLRLTLEKVPFFALSAASSFLTLYIQMHSGAAGSLERFSMEARFFNAVASYARYIEKMIWPWNLAVLYPYADRMALWQVAVASILLITITLLAILWARTKPYLVVGWLWYLGTLVPVIGLVQVGSQAMADRYTYVPLIGLFIIMAMGTADLLAGWRHRRTALLLSGLLVLLFFMAAARLQVNYWQNSITLFEHTLRVTSKNFTIHNNLGIALEEQGKIQEAVFHYSEALRIKPDYALAQYNLATILARQGKIEEAITRYAKALQIDPNLFEAHNNLGNVMAQRGRILEAAAHYQQALRINPNYAEAHSNLASVLAQQLKIQEAVFHYSRAIQIKPGYSEAHYSLAQILAQQGKAREAVHHYSQALRINPDHAGAHNNLGNLLFQQGNIQEAAHHYSQALRIDPHSAEIHNNLGNALAREGKNQEATNHFTQALQINPDFAEAQNNLGNALAQQGKIREAANHYSQALRIKPDYADAHNNFGIILTQQKRYDDAISHFSTALRIRPNAAEIHGNLGTALAKQGKLKDAVVQLRNALQMNPDYTEAHFSLGEILVRQGKLQEGIFHLTQALRTKPDLAEAHFSLGMAYWRTGNREWALEEYKILKTINPDLADSLSQKIK